MSRRDLNSKADYSRVAGSYASHRKHAPEIVNGLVAGGRVGRDTEVLEVGCGTGKYIGRLARTAHRATGLDPAREMLAAAAGAPSVGLAVERVMGTGEALPFADSRFDLVYTVDVVHNVPDIRALLTEMGRVLRPGGLACTASDTARAEGDGIIGRFFPETIALDARRYSTTDHLIKEMRAAGFSGVENRPVALTKRVTNVAAFRAKAFSVLTLIDEAAFQAGLKRLESALEDGPVETRVDYALVWGVVAT